MCTANEIESLWSAGEVDAYWVSSAGYARLVTSVRTLLDPTLSRLALVELLGDEFECEPRGTVSVKGKGDMETWYLVGRGDALSGRADPLRASGGTP